MTSCKETKLSQQTLDKIILELKSCQESTNKSNSCTDCTKFFECKIRTDYVLSVYTSMNPDLKGGFEF